MNMHSISCHFFQKWKIKFPPGCKCPAPYWLQHHSSGTCLLPSLVKVYQEQHPEIKIYVTVKNTGTIEQAVVDNQLDFALVEGTVTHPEIISEVFSADTLCMVAAPGHPLAANRTVTLADAASCPLLLREPGSAGGKSSKVSFYPGGIQIAPAWESVSTLALIRAAQNGLGIAILPELLVRDALKSGDLVSLPLPPDILTPQPIPDPAPQQIPFVLRRGISEFMPDVEILSG